MYRLFCTMFAAVALFLPWGFPAAAKSVMVGEVTRHTVAEGETFAALMRRYGVGYVELVAANQGVDPWIPPVGTVLDIPTRHLLPDVEHRGIVINLGDMRLYYFPEDGGQAQSYPIGIGREGWETPVGTTRVVRKRENPVWIPTPSMREANPSLPRAVAPGPDNPLGTHALDLGWPAYVVHGTNRPLGVGRRVSHGCIRLAPDHIIALYDQVSVGTPVTVVDQPIKLGRVGDELYLQVHPTRNQVDELEQWGVFTPEPIDDISPYIRYRAGRDLERLDWDAIDQALAERRGLPVRITTPDARDRPRLQAGSGEMS